MREIVKETDVKTRRIAFKIIADKARMGLWVRIYQLVIKDLHMVLQEYISQIMLNDLHMDL